METTTYHIAVRITKEDKRQLKELVQKLGETQSQVIRRSLHDLHYKMLNVEHKD